MLEFQQLKKLIIKPFECTKQPTIIYALYENAHHFCQLRYNG